MKAVFWTSAANRDLVEISEYLAKESIDSAEAFVNSIDERLTNLSEFPQLGGVIPELERHNVTRFRELVLAPWRIVYKEQQEKIFIVAVFDGRRNIEDILLRRLLRD